jgi:hypothetical protein
LRDPQIKVRQNAVAMACADNRRSCSEEDERLF